MASLVAEGRVSNVGAWSAVQASIKGSRQNMMSKLEFDYKPLGGATWFHGLCVVHYADKAKSIGACGVELLRNDINGDTVTRTAHAALYVHVARARKARRVAAGRTSPAAPASASAAGNRGNASETQAETTAEESRS
jgi:hypothetical protein